MSIVAAARLAKLRRSGIDDPRDNVCANTNPCRSYGAWRKLRRVGL